ncbi:hypothetical protein BU26DRAFT_570557 [Trematosphaeria pertusa]|uniref:Uncharacterized protein n=1 Tax=Trematosphaeria pertusa TaxID=390896 RepID=A0A6A6HZL6_9PLEO|nr:uncharacterized protein BU26DRAFT_570557 [Trematosphaeria pertusa]KAF2243162.1 hypothetical protein BU26DRAFT_570557 [Trematosphaeria pertusa]
MAWNTLLPCSEAPRPATKINVLSLRFVQNIQNSLYPASEHFTHFSSTTLLIVAYPSNSCALYTPQPSHHNGTSLLLPLSLPRLSPLTFSQSQIHNGTDFAHEFEHRSKTALGIGLGVGLGALLLVGIIGVAYVIFHNKRHAAGRTTGIVELWRKVLAKFGFVWKLET